MSIILLEIQEEEPGALYAVFFWKGHSGSESDSMRRRCFLGTMELGDTLGIVMLLKYNWPLHRRRPEKYEGYNGSMCSRLDASL